jgi:hypothetical protein
MIETVRLLRAVVPPLFCLALAVCCASCGDDAPQPKTAADTPAAAAPVPMPMEGPRDTTFDPENVEAFHDVVYKQYAYLALQLPRRVMDSILATAAPMDMDKAMTARLRVQDTIARQQLAAKYGISRDSVDAILAEHNVPKQ